MKIRIIYIVIAAAFVIIVGSYVVSLTSHKTPALVKTSTNPNFQTASSSNIHAPFDSALFFANEIRFWNNPTFTSSSTNYRVSFKILADASHRSINPTYDVYVNTRLAGEVEGQGLSMPSFSPDEKYFAFRTRYDMGCAGACESTKLSIVDLSDLKVANVAPQDKSDLRYIESYTWNLSNHSVDVVSYGINNDLFRSTSKNIWACDLTSENCTLLKSE